MGVGASVSLPVLISGKLWGLVVGHSYHGPRLLSHEQRHCASLLTNAFSLGLANFQAGESLRLVDSIDRNVHNAMLPLLQTDSPLQVFADCAQALKSLLNADGLALAVGGNAAIAADGLSLEALADLDRWFVEDHQDALLMTDHLADTPVNGMNIVSVFSGALAIKSWSSKHGWLRFYWFRLSETQEIAWAGNPDKPAEPHGHTLGPRRSFEKWLEVRHGYSREWTAADRLSALRVRSIASRLI
jgi:chemotaxis family two-component system sensor kinase Cph1